MISDEHKFIRHSIEEFIHSQRIKPATRKICLMDRNGKLDEKSVSRIGGIPHGVTREIWPKYDDKWMRHIISIDLKETGGITLDVPPGTRSISLFAIKGFEEDLRKYGTGKSKVLFLTEEEVSRGIDEKCLKLPQVRSYSLSILTVDAPVKALSPKIQDDYSDPHWGINAFIINTPMKGCGDLSWRKNRVVDKPILFDFSRDLVSIGRDYLGAIQVFNDEAYSDVALYQQSETTVLRCELEGHPDYHFGDQIAA